jgi:hypothetical protein
MRRTDIKANTEYVVDGKHIVVPKNTDLAVVINDGSTRTVRKVGTFEKPDPLGVRQASAKHVYMGDEGFECDLYDFDPEGNRVGDPIQKWPVCISPRKFKGTWDEYKKHYMKDIKTVAEDRIGKEQMARANDEAMSAARQLFAGMLNRVPDNFSTHGGYWYGIRRYQDRMVPIDKVEVTFYVRPDEIESLISDELKPYFKLSHVVDLDTGDEEEDDSDA